MGKEISKDFIMKIPRVDRSCDHKEDEFVVVFDRILIGAREVVGKTIDGEEVAIDPFVGCTWDWERRQELLGMQATVKGYWGCQFPMSWKRTFITNEKDGITFIPS